MTEADRTPERGPEEQRESMPRIWVASLSDYNAGYRHGVWIDATQPVEDIWTEITAMLAGSHEPSAEEHAIFDHDGFGGIPIGEYESIETVAELAGGIIEHGRPFAAFARYIDSAEWAECRQRFENSYCGTWESAREFAENYLEALGIDPDDLPVPEILQPYLRLDVDALADGLLDGHLVVREEDGSLHVFDP